MRKLLVFLAVSVLLCLLSGAAQAWSPWNWQVHYYGIHWWSGVDIKYWWTDTWGMPLETDGDGKAILHDLHLDRCEWKNVPAPFGAEDQRFQGAYFVTEKRCDGKTAALRHDGNRWVSDMSGFLANTGSITWPSGFASPDMDVYWAVDIAAYHQAGGTQYQPGQEFSIVNGICPSLPGFKFGTSPFYLDAALGLVTDGQMLTATVTTEAEEGICPEPGSLLALGSGLAAMAGMAVRRRR